ncbi:Stromal membrane-associated protein 1 [Fasciolopsis buskii]|uniref:Stromal membrane-associated protein 1 n=1 Tax=Fasciolopsis buskii TaxID=27845 RepID=A0A8E0VF06_9TREM|nr:Stromal membrane-associated protein 1 [Fasciolopsis buski]
MSGKKDQEKLQAERHQLVIQELLRDEDNKYCVDCDAKVSGNCLVHPVCLLILFFQMMREMGNSRARAIYEAKLPDNFRRPQSDSALETFIRSKYEQKRYIAPNYVPIKPDVDGLAKVHTFSSVEKCTVFHPDHLFY